MARSNIPMVINLRQNKNDDSTAGGLQGASEFEGLRQAHDEPRQDRRLSDVCAGAGSGGRVHE